MLRRFLGLVLAALIAFPASAAEVGSRRTLLSGGKIAPVWSCNFLTGVFCNGLTYTMSGSIPATLFDSTGKLTYSGNNLKTYSNTFTDASWTKGSSTISNANAVADPFGGTQASTITANAGYAYLQGLYSSTTGYNALSSIWVRLRSGNGALTLYNTNGTGSVAKTATSNWQQIYVAGTSGGVHTYLKLEITNSGDVLDIYQGGISFVTYETTPRSVDQVITTSAAYYAPRFDYDPSTLAPRGMLIEGAGTNLLPYSNLFTSWTITAGTPTGNLVGPDGVTNSGWTFTENASGSNQWQFYQSFSTTSGTYTMSAFVKAGTQRYMQFGADTGTHSAWVTIDTTNFSTSTGVGGSATIASAPVVQTIANGWYRVSFAFTLPTTVTTYYKAGLAGSTTPGSFIPTYAGTSKTGSFYGIQLEAGSFPTSYIPTTSSTATRAADVVTFANPALAALQGAQASAIVEFDLEGLSASANAMPIGSAVHGVVMYRAAGGALGADQSYVQGWTTTGSINSINTPYRGGMAYRNGYQAVALNGGTPATTAYAFSPYSAGLGYYLGSDATPAQNLNGHVRSLAIYNQALPPPTLKARSVVGAPYQ